ncbi:hypothetical protein [Psychrobacter sp. DAB_AL43B]|uniref:hypothetical protein n=1 Tax=Psychrobacter sp. DAB_AL43B TaxID=1028416 RepID=UPI001D0D5812|nr:hypothetical protein [Psychrobacter sp. DAB_AL43B]
MKKQNDVQVSPQGFDAIMMLAITTVTDDIGSAPDVDTPLFDEAHEAYCAELFQNIVGWQEQNNRARLSNTKAAQTYIYAKREALIKVAETRLYNALHKGDCISEKMM